MGTHFTNFSQPFHHDDINEPHEKPLTKEIVVDRPNAEEGAFENKQPRP